MGSRSVFFVMCQMGLNCKLCLCYLTIFMYLCTIYMYHIKSGIGSCIALKTVLARPSAKWRYGHLGMSSRIIGSWWSQGVYWRGPGYILSTQGESPSTFHSIPTPQPHFNSVTNLKLKYCVIRKAGLGGPLFYRLGWILTESKAQYTALPYVCVCNC